MIYKIINQLIKFRKRLIIFNNNIKRRKNKILNPLLDDIQKFIRKINEIKKNNYQSIHTQRYFANYLNLPTDLNNLIKTFL